MARQRGEFAAVRRLIQSENDEGEAGVVAVLVEERFQVTRVFGLDGDIGPAVGPNRL